MVQLGTNRRRGRAARLVSALALAGLALSACGGGGGNDGAAGVERTTTTTEPLGDPVSGGILTVGLEAETNSLLPGEGAFAAAGYNVAYALYDPLMARNSDGEIEPFLAESMEVNDDLTEWTLKLRPGITFHDGSALTAEVLKGNFEMISAPSSNLSGTLEQVEEVEVVDELTVVYRLQEGNAVFSDLLATAQGMPFSMEAAAQHGENYGSNPVGTGPFAFKSWRRDDRLELVKNEDYWREGIPYLDGIVFRPIPDEESRVSSLRGGEVDAMISLRGSAIKQVEESGPDYFAHLHVGNESNGSIINVLEPPFDDVRIRKAFAHALNPEDIAVVLGDDGLVEPSTQFFSADSHWFSQKVADAYPTYDPERARELVAEYVDDPDRSDGQPVGTPPRMKFNCVPDASLLEISQLAQQEGEAAGFRVELEQLEQAVHVGRAIGSEDTDPPFKGDYLVNCWRMGNEDDPATTFSAAFGDPTTESLNFTNFHSDEIEELVEELRTTRAFQDRYELVEQIGLLINEAQPYVFATGTPTMIGGRAEVKNVAGWTLPSGATGEGTPNARARWGEVWIED
jgi:peptide/nickel transport system substrate-binding protein